MKRAKPRTAATDRWRHRLLLGNAVRRAVFVGWSAAKRGDDAGLPAQREALVAKVLDEARRAGILPATPTRRPRSRR